MPELSDGLASLVQKKAQEMDSTQQQYLDLSPTDVAAVKDIRRALRRKYACRSNLGRIFAQWDKGSKGNLSIDDLINGVTRAGITLTHEQACTLFASAKSSQA